VLRVLALVVLLLAATGSAVGDCRKCKGAGVLPCQSCERNACQGRVEALHCSVLLRCRECDGLGVLDCAKCEREPVPGAAERRAAGQAWLSEVGAVDQHLEKQVVHGESAHFRVSFDVPKYVAEGVRPKQRSHDGMHVTLDRLEALYEAFCVDLDAGDADFFARTHVMIWAKERDHQRASQRFTGQASNTQSKLMGAKPVVSIYYDKSHLHEEAELHQAVVHQVVHCLLSNVFDGIWPGNVGGGWIDAGLAHRYEIEMFGGVRHYCYVESDTMRRFKFGKWESAIRRAVDRDEALPFVQIAGKQTGELTPEQHMTAWSYCDFLLREHPAAFPVIARGIKAKRPLAKTLKEALGMSVFELEAAWKEFVRANYALKPKKR